MKQLPAGWKETTLGDIVEIVGWWTPKTSEPQYWNWNIPWLSVVDFNNDNRRVYYTEKTITEEGLKNSSTKILNEWDLIISARWTVWALAQLKRDMAFNQSCYGIKQLDGVSDKNFLFYLLKNSISFLSRNVHWAVFDTITRETFDIIPIHLPPLPEQQAIAAVLSSFDDKIELLRAENQTLEQMGQELFKERFGKWKVGDVLPEGWRVGKLGEIWIQITQKVKEESDRVVLSAVNTGNLVLSEEYFSKQVYSNSISKYIVCNKWDFAYNPARINIWSIWRNSYWNGAVSPVYVVFRSKEGFGRFLEYIFKSRKFNDHVAKYSNWSVRQALNYDWFSRFELIIPWNDILVKFNNTLQVFEKKIKRNLEQIQSLSATRDQLLPKLMSGEVRVEF